MSNMYRAISNSGSINHSAPLLSFLRWPYPHNGLAFLQSHNCLIIACLHITPFPFLYSLTVFALTPHLFAFLLGCVLSLNQYTSFSFMAKQSPKFPHIPFPSKIS